MRKGAPIPRSIRLTDFFGIRLKVSLSKAIQNLPSEKRDGGDVAYASYRKLIAQDASSNVALNLLNRADALPALQTTLKEDPDTVIADFEALRQCCA